MLFQSARDMIGHTPLVGRTLGHPVHIVTDPRIDPITLAKLRSLDAQVHVVESMTGAGWQSARLERLAELMRDLPGAFWPRQYTNPDNPRAYQSLVQGLIDDLGTVDVLVGAVGSGGSLCGSTREQRLTWPRLRWSCVAITLLLIMAGKASALLVNGLGGGGFQLTLGIVLLVFGPLTSLVLLGFVTPDHSDRTTTRTTPRTDHLGTSATRGLRRNPERMDHLATRSARHS